MAPPPDGRLCIGETGRSVLSLDETQVADRLFGYAACALQIHQQTGVFQHRCQLAAGGFQGHDVAGLKVIRLGVLDHQHADLHHSFLNGNR